MTRPAVSLHSATLITASGGSYTPAANARGMAVVGFRPGTSPGSHDMTGVSFGGVALTTEGAGRITAQVFGNTGHICVWYLDDWDAFDGRASNVLTFTGGTMGTGSNQYRAYVIWITHATNKVVRAAYLDDVAGLIAGQSLSVSPNPGSGVDAQSLIMEINRVSTSITDLSGQNRLAGPVGLTTGNFWVNVSEEAVTGAHAVGYTNPSGNTPLALAAQAWVEGDALTEEHEASPVLTGGGVLTLDALKVGQLLETLSGGGVVAVGQETRRDASIAMTGGGITTVDQETRRDALPSLTGGGVVTADPASIRLLEQALTGGGVLVLDTRTIRGSSVVLSGGGIVIVDGGKFILIVEASPVLTGGGLVTVQGRKTAIAAPAVSGGGAVIVDSLKVAQLIAAITGGGIVAIDGFFLVHWDPAARAILTAQRQRATVVNAAPSATIRSLAPRATVARLEDPD